jgi:putative ABC transport system ATP-binding protein
MERRAIGGEQFGPATVSVGRGKFFMSEGLILQVEKVSKTYRSGSHALTVLKELSFSLQEGATCSIVGPSGSGKTTLLGLCAGLDQASSGSVRIAGRDLTPMSEDQRAAVRNQLVGFVFQNFQLIPTLTALENVMVPLELRGRRDARQPAIELLERVGLGQRLNHYPVQLSGGEQQRVALARAFINRPRILFADEPTGNLDAETSERVIEILFELNRESGTSLVLVTHDLELARLTDRTIRLRNGAMVEEECMVNCDG